ncbi:MAG: Type 1 glutamine amidotransferase-like domain-containing protein [Bacteroidota bacterium]
MSEQPFQPIYLLADSQPLMGKTPQGEARLAAIRQRLTSDDPLAVYIGASNGDEPAFYQLFCAGMAQMGVQNCQHVAYPYTETDMTHVQKADLILLAGGDTFRGWSCLCEYGLDQLLLDRYRAGCLLMGVSAGAIQLGQGSVQDGRFVPMLGLVPWMIDAHDEANQWKSLQVSRQFAPANCPALGIVTASALVYFGEEQYELIGEDCVMYPMPKDQVWKH